MDASQEVRNASRPRCGRSQRLRSGQQRGREVSQSIWSARQPDGKRPRRTCRSRRWIGRTAFLESNEGDPSVRSRQAPPGRVCRWRARGRCRAKRFGSESGCRRSAGFHCSTVPSTNRNRIGRGFRCFALCTSMVRNGLGPQSYPFVSFRSGILAVFDQSGSMYSGFRTGSRSMTVPVFRSTMR